MGWSLFVSGFLEASVLSRLKLPKAVTRSVRMMSHVSVLGYGGPFSRVVAMTPVGGKSAEGVLSTAIIHSVLLPGPGSILLGVRAKTGGDFLAEALDSEMWVRNSSGEYITSLSFTALNEKDYLGKTWVKLKVPQKDAAGVKDDVWEPYYDASVAPSFTAAWTVTVGEDFHLTVHGVDQNGQWVADLRWDSEEVPLQRVIISKAVTIELP